MSTRPRHPAHQCRAAFKKAVREGKPLFGLFLGSSSPLVAEQLAYLQYDYMLIDIQHAPTDYANLAAMITAVNAAGKPALVRVEGPHDRGGIQQSLDLGAAGVMIPTVNSRADVQAAAAACYYPSEAYPDASRSIAFPIRPQFGRDKFEYLSNANDEVTLIVQCETRQCFEKLEEVIGVPGLDCLFMGPVDLSNDLGMIRRHGFPDCIGAPEFQACMSRVAQACKLKGMALGNFALNDQTAQEMLAQGFTLLATGTDLGLLGQAAAKQLAFLKLLREESSEESAQ